MRLIDTTVLTFAKAEEKAINQLQLDFDVMNNTYITWTMLMTRQELSDMDASTFESTMFEYVDKFFNGDITKLSNAWVQCMGELVTEMQMNYEQALENYKEMQYVTDYRFLR